MSLTSRNDTKCQVVAFADILKQRHQVPKLYLPESNDSQLDVDGTQSHVERLAVLAVRISCGWASSMESMEYDTLILRLAKTEDGQDALSKCYDSLPELHGAIYSVLHEQ